MKNLTLTLCFALLCSVGFAQAPMRKAPEKHNMVKEKASSEEKIKPTSSKYPTKPSPNNQDVNKRATSPANTMVKEKPSSSVEAKNKYPTKPGVSNEEKRASSPANTMVKEKPSSSVEAKNKYPTKPGVSNEEKRGSATDNKNFSPNAPTSSKGDKLQDKTSKTSPGKTDKKYSPNAPSSTTGNTETRSGGDPHSGTTFCTGWQAGYSKGFMKVNGTKPDIIPACPEFVPSGCEDYKCGYATGTKAGQIAAKKQQ